MGSTIARLALISLTIYFTAVDCWANQCLSFYNRLGIPAFTDSRYVDYELSFPLFDKVNDKIMISFAINSQGISILNREEWRNYSLSENEADRVPLRIRVTSKDQFDIMNYVVEEYGRNATRVKILEAKADKFSTSVMQRMAGYIQLGKIDTESVIKIDEFDRGLTENLKIEIKIPIYQHEYTHENIEDLNSVRMAKTTFQYDLKPTRQETQIWGAKGDRHSVVIGEQTFALNLTKPSQLELLYRILGSGSGWKILAIE